VNWERQGKKQSLPNFKHFPQLEQSKTLKFSWSPDGVEAVPLSNNSIYLLKRLPGAVK
jgi:hypothetical protein